MRCEGFVKVFLLVFLLSLLSASVDAFEVDVVPIENTIMADGTAVFELMIRNTDSRKQDFLLSTNDFRWNVLSDPLSDYFSGFSIEDDDRKIVRLSLTTRGDLFFGIYMIRLELISRTTGEKKIIDLPIEIRPEYAGTIDYAPSVVVDATVNNNNIIDPRQPSVLVLNLDNRNRLNISELEVIVESDFITEKVITSLGPLEKKRIEFNFDVDPYEEPDVHNFILKLVYDDKLIGSTPRSFPVQVISYSQIVVAEESENGFLSHHKSFKLENKGNIENSEVLKVSTNFFSRLFTSTSPSPKVVKEDGERLMVWDVAVSPGSVVEIDIRTNYRPLAYFFAISAVVVLLYFMLRSPVLVKKTTASVDMHEGGVSELKVLIHLRNRTAKQFNAFSVTEYVPKIAKFLKSESLGSVQPDRILNHERRGTLLKWNFEAIEPFEERIIIYKMKLNFAVIGKINLPSTVVKFKDEAGSSYTAKSNKMKMSHPSNDDDKKGKKGGNS
ncbi:MAG: hypothetical protein ACOCUR_02635 [Nanoarchaeota archaeon]